MVKKNTSHSSEDFYFSTRYLFMKKVYDYIQHINDIKNNLGYLAHLSAFYV